MARKSPSLKYQTIEKMKQMACFGESKHKAKQKARSKGQNPNKLDGIYSYSTFETYKNQTMRFVEWERKHNPDIKLISEIPKQHFLDYLNNKKDSGDSAYTLKTIRASLNKVFGADIGTEDIELPVRHTRDITRSRIAREHDSRFDEKQNSQLVDFCKGTGLRRHEIVKITPRDIAYGEDEKLSVHVRQGKGGKERFATVRAEYVAQILDLKKSVPIDGKIFPNISQYADIHSYRREYAHGRYEEELQKQEYNISHYTKQDVYISKYDHVERKKLYFSEDKVFDREVVETVTRDLGHNRVEVAIRHYLTM